MSLLNRAVRVVVAWFPTAWDGAFLGITLACYAVRSWANYFMLSSALRRIQAAPNLRVSDLRLLLNVEEDDANGPLVVVRGSVQPKSVFDRWRMAFPFVSRSVVVQRIRTCIYNEWTGLFGWKFDLFPLLFNSMKRHESSSLRSIPFQLVESSTLDSICTVNLDGSAHELPLATVYHGMDLVQPSRYTLLQVLLGLGCPLAMLKEEKILLVEKEITAVGICTRRGGAVEIKSCRDLPFFLSDMTRGEIEANMASKSLTHFLSGSLVGIISLGILRYAIHRYIRHIHPWNWLRWKEWTERRQTEEIERETISESNGDDETGNVADGEQCVVCLMRWRRAAFVPCGHFVCCPHCALTIVREASPMCPVCRQSVRTAIRIYAS